MATVCQMPLLYSLASLSFNPERLYLRRSFSQRPLLFLTFPCRVSVSVSESIRQSSLEETHNAEDELAEILAQECGFNCKQLSYVLSVTKGMNKSPEKFQKLLKLFKDAGLKPNQIKKIVNKNPPVLSLRAEGTLKAKIEFFKSMGLLASVSRCPRVLNSSLEKTLLPRFMFMSNICGSEDALVQILRSSLGILLMDVEKRVRPTMDLLQQNGIQKEQLLEIIGHCPTILAKEDQEISSTLQFLKEIGVTESCKGFSCTLKVVLQLGLDAVKKRIGHLEALGFMEDEAKEIFRRHPQLFINCSMEKIEKVVSFVKDTLGLPTNFFVTDPYVFNFGFDSRMRPRFRVLKALFKSQPDLRIRRLTSVCSMSEKAFLDRYVNKSTHPQELLKIYQES
eukprot:TRINITY_DN25215_c0_g1_i1.p1 TRINITY_DN25215_c0_g1~~TRINITY_DN25215_c0_g1_i1.p1  ORF type:complete len:394 (+),score=52.34 TRINITY_DN25215_c0_g1_i1:225-1406(+)